jgi:hypothetical protein
VGRQPFAPRERVAIDEAFKRAMARRQGRPQKGGQLPTFSEDGKTRVATAEKAFRLTSN